MSYSISLIKIPVSDIKQSAKFYQTHLGLSLDFIAEAYGWANLSLGDFSISIYEPGKGGGQRTMGGSVDFHLTVESSVFDRLAMTLEQAGVLVDSQVHTGADGTTFMEIIDPDQNTLKLFRA